MSTATVIEMRARPVTSSHLCFEVNGILDQLNVQLGSPVVGFPFRLVLRRILALITASGDPFSPCL